ncbi:MAG: CehA/McbA family metallohydrolase, partial [Planctomycetota bacterium]|nr:CehA/McbA family metallohydrolase [Planctomycetota bacterium]
VAGDNLEITSNSNTRTSTLQYRPVGGSDKVDLEPGKAYELTRRIFPATNLIDIKSSHAEQGGLSTHPARLLVKDAIDRPVAGALVLVSQAGKSFGSGRTSDDGKLACQLPSGDYQLTATADGVAMFNKPMPFRVITQEAPQSIEAKSESYFTGTVNAQIKGENGRPIPCKVEFLAKAGTPQPDFGPETAEFAVKSLRYTVDGRFSQRLPVGSYDVVISRGPEYDAVSLELTVLAGQSVPLQATLERVVDTAGWISSDFHSHSSPSGDNTGSQFGRVLNLVCEHVEFAPCTEHNRVSSYEPHIKRLGIEPFISTVSGMELTGSPLPLNHQNVFPMVQKFGRQDGGGPVTDGSPETQIERAALWDNRSEKLVQQNHPDPGWLFYDKDGDGNPDGGYQRAFPFMDVMEIHPIEAVMKLGPDYMYPIKRPFHNRVFNWLQLLNQGFRIFGVVNTDAHYNFHGSSSVRNWIQSPTDDPAQIKPMDVVHAAEQGRLVMSNGPYLEASLVETGQQRRVVSGEDIVARSGDVTLSVRAQAANWVEVDRVFVLVNGRVHKSHDYNRTDHPDRFRAGTVRFEAKLQLKLKSDSHVIVVCGSNKPLGPKVVGPFWGTYQAAAITNPIFVDIDGDGFKPNKDTLGHPLPVKFGVRPK